MFSELSADFSIQAKCMEWINLVYDSTEVQSDYQKSISCARQNLSLQPTEILSHGQIFFFRPAKKLTFRVSASALCFGEGRYFSASLGDKLINID